MLHTPVTLFCRKHTSFAYDNHENLTSVIDRRGFATSYSYDQLFRPVAKSTRWARPQALPMTPRITSSPRLTGLAGT